MRPQLLLPPALALLLVSHGAAQTTSELFRLESRFDGEDLGDELGLAVSDAGDVNGDGVPDLIIGAPYSSAGGFFRAGTAYVYSGVDGSTLFTLNGEDDNDLLGLSVAGAGDVDGDGYDDIIVGIPNADPVGLPIHAGSAVVVSVETGTLLWRFNGGAFFDQLGTSVAGVGDVNGDGVPDLAVGAPFMDPGGRFSAGSAIVYSGADGTELGRLNGPVDGANMGFAVAAAGDVNNDGFQDVIVGAPRDEPGGASLAGAAYVLGGGAAGLLFQIDGSADDQLGLSVDGVGDVNGDGFDDVIVGVPFGDPGGIPDAGSARVHSGADGSVLWELNGAVSGEQFGTAVAGTGDADGDGVGDFLVGTPFADPGGLIDAGAAFVHSGADGLEIGRLEGAVAGMQFGFSVSGADDRNGDGNVELMVGAPFADIGGWNDAGSAFLFERHPILDLTADQLSRGAGGSVDFLMQFPSAEAGQPYQILASLGGTGPTTLGSLVVPLTRDFLFNSTLAGNYPPITSGFAGNLDGSAAATGNVTAGPGQLPAASVGRVYYLASITANYASVARTLTIIP